MNLFGRIVVMKLLTRSCDPQAQARLKTAGPASLSNSDEPYPFSA